MKTPDVCPVCFEEVPPRSKACPHCGADERSGWKEDALLYDGLDLPEEAWEEPDSDPAVSKRDGDSSAGSGGWQIAVVVVLLAIAFWRLVSRWLS